MTCFRKTPTQDFGSSLQLCGFGVAWKYFCQGIIASTCGQMLRSSSPGTFLLPTS